MLRVRSLFLGGSEDTGLIRTEEEPQQARRGGIGKDFERTGSKESQATADVSMLSLKSCWAF